MVSYVERTGAGGPGSAQITNDDDWLLVLPDDIDDSQYDYGQTKDERSL